MSELIPDRAAQRLRDAQHVVVFTGAGVSAESGIPTFRDALTGAAYEPASLFGTLPVAVLESV